MTTPEPPGGEIPLEFSGPMAMVRGPLISWLTQWYAGDGPAQGDDIVIPDELLLLSVLDLTAMFLDYVREVEEKHGGDFREFLQRAAVVPYLGNTNPSALR